MTWWWLLVGWGVGAILFTLADVRFLRTNEDARRMLEGMSPASARWCVAGFIATSGLIWPVPVVWCAGRAIRRG